MLEGLFFVQTLGCAKNVADSDGIQSVLEQAGLRATEHSGDADVLIVNTCGFLQSAREESLDALRALGQTKRKGQLLIASGCLISRYGAVVQSEVPQVDGVIDAGRWLAMPRFIEWLREHGRREAVWSDIGAPIRPSPGSESPQGREAESTLSTDMEAARSVVAGLKRRAAGPSAFLKIADGCDRPCTFCIIPAIKGMHRSKSPDAVIAEARDLVAQGVKEIVLVAQDTTAYGWDWGQRDQLAPLLERLCREVEGLNWLRLMYAYPGHVTPRLVETMARLPQVVHYLDLPLQHAHPDVLQRMKRPNPVVTRRLLDAMRAAMPDLAVRTTFIVGFPGETDAEFEGLLEFLEEQQFDRVGVFEYSREEGTPAALLPGQLPQQVKAQRRGAAMALQQSISLARNRRLVGATLDVLVEGAGKLAKSNRRASAAASVVSVGRSYRDAPEVDGVVLVPGRLPEGEIVPVKITHAAEYDLIGEPE